MKTKNINKENCNIFIPRNIISLSLILSKKKNYKEDNYILINKNKKFSHRITNDVINFLKKKKFEIIFTNKEFIPKQSKNTRGLFMQKVLKLNYVNHLYNIFNSALKTKYEEFNNINFKKYKSINIYYSTNIFYFGKLYTRFKHINLFFLEHGIGNFLSFVANEDSYHHSLKRKMKSFLEILFFKIIGISLPNNSYYYGILGKIFDTKELNYNNHITKFINSNYKNGFNQLYKFYKKKLIDLKKNNKKNYIFLDIDTIYTKKIYLKFLKLVFKKIKYKKNYILLMKFHPNHNISDYYIHSLKELLKKNKINYYFLNPRLRYIPVEIICKFFKVKEIYTPLSSNIFTISYFINNKININLMITNNIRKKFENYLELKTYTLDFIKKNYIYKNINIININ